MRPTPAETVEGVRRILRDVIEPAVDSDYAKARLREVRAVLAQVDWNDAALGLHAEIVTAHSLLASVREWVDADTARTAHFATLPAPPAAPTWPVPYLELDAAHLELAGQLTQAATLLDDWCRSHPGDQSARALRLRLIRALATAPSDTSH